MALANRRAMLRNIRRELLGGLDAFADLEVVVIDEGDSIPEDRPGLIIIRYPFDWDSEEPEDTSTFHTTNKEPVEPDANAETTILDFAEEEGAGTSAETELEDLLATL